MAQSFSDGSGGFETDSSKEEPGHGGPGGERASRRTDRRAERDRAARRESLEFCVVIPDLQQSVSTHLSRCTLFSYHTAGVCYTVKNNVLFQLIIIK